MSKALSDLEDFFDDMVGDEPGFDVIADVIEYIHSLRSDNRWMIGMLSSIERELTSSGWIDHD